MEMKGEQLIPAPQQAVWDALNDPGVLKACVPGCESLEKSGDNEYQVLMVARVGPVSAKFKGRLTLSDINPPSSYSISFRRPGRRRGIREGQRPSELVFRRRSYQAVLRSEGERRRQAGADRLAPGRRGGEKSRRRLLQEFQ